MPKKSTLKHARQGAREGKKPTTQAGEFVREKMREMKSGKSDIKSPQQAVAIGLSEARRSGVKLPAPKKGQTSDATRAKAQRDVAQGQGRRKPSPTRSRGAKKAAATRRRRSRQSG